LALCTVDAAFEFRNKTVYVGCGNIQLYIVQEDRLELVLLNEKGYQQFLNFIKGLKQE